MFSDSVSSLILVSVKALRFWWSRKVARGFLAWGRICIEGARSLCRVSALRGYVTIVRGRDGLDGEEKKGA